MMNKRVEMNKKYLFYVPLVPALLSGLLLGSCSREVYHELDAPSGSLLFSVTETVPDLETKSLSATAQWISLRCPDTKAAKIYGSGDVTPLGGDPIAVWAYNMPESGSPVSAWLVDGGSPSAVTATYDNGLWRPASRIMYNTSRLADSYYTRWFAVAPQTAVGNGVVLGSIAAGTAPTLNYTVPATASSQPDLMVASTDPRAIDEDSAVPLNFSHVLTGVRLVADTGINLTAATLSGVYKSGTLNLLSKEWTLNTGVIGSFDFDFTSETSSTLLMLPQWLPSGAKLSYTVDGITREADLSGHEWKMGKRVVYRIVGFDYHIEVEQTGDLSAEISCYATSLDGSTSEAAPWIVKGVYSTRALAEAGGTPDLDGSWTVTKEGNSLSVTAPAASTVSKTVTALLREAAEWGTSDSPWNLSNPVGGGDAIRESANTYIVNAPGYYRIPLVIGNGIKNGTPNAAAYPFDFVDYKGEPIQSPYLHKSSASVGTPYSGAIVWEETAGMVEGISVSATGEGDSQVYWLSFRVRPANITQGCTVVSVKDNAGTVMWSWLLWFTDMEAGAGDVACTNATFMPRNLGWSVDGTLTGVKPAASAFVRVEVEADPDTYAVVMVHRAAEWTAALPHAGHGPLFQWGRKDAMPPTGSQATQSSGNTPQDLIKNPDKHFNNSCYAFRVSGSTGDVYSWWNADAEVTGYSGKTVKTVYDPCPAGYTVPRLNAFDSFDISVGSWDAGYTFHSSVYFPAKGERGPAGSGTVPMRYTENGYYWTSSAHGSGTSRRMILTASNVSLPTAPTSQDKATENSIRPAREE